jgi:ATP-binding cassette subfamily F protein uup
VLGLEEGSKPERFADYSQWAAELAARKKAKPKAAPPVAGASAAQAPVTTKKKLSYIESREYEAMEQKIADLEAALREKRASLETVALETSYKDPHKDPRRLETLYKEIEAAQQEIDGLYIRWGALEEKMC